MELTREAELDARIKLKHMELWTNQAHGILLDRAHLLGAQAEREGALLFKSPGVLDEQFRYYDLGDAKDRANLELIDKLRHTPVDRLDDQFQRREVQDINAADKGALVKMRERFNLRQTRNDQPELNPAAREALRVALITKLDAQRETLRDAAEMAKFSNDIRDARDSPDGQLILHGVAGGLCQNWSDRAKVRENRILAANDRVYAAQTDAQRILTQECRPAIRDLAPRNRSEHERTARQQEQDQTQRERTKDHFS